MPYYGLITAPFRRSVLFNMLRLCIGVSAQSIASARIDLRAQNKNGVQQGGRHCTGQKEAHLCRNEDKYFS